VTCRGGESLSHQLPQRHPLLLLLPSMLPPPPMPMLLLMLLKLVLVLMMEMYVHLLRQRRR
jgi:hypothetical protein